MRVTLPPAGGDLAGFGTGPDLTTAVRRWRARYLALSGRPVDVATALEWGLIDGVASPAPPQAPGLRLP